MVLRSEYSLAHSQFNKFLFAYASEEGSDLSLAALFSLARLGIGSWEEAAGLSEMPEVTATT